MQLVDCSDVRLAYDTAGEDGSPVLLVMGYTVPGRAWVHQVPELSKHHRVAWYDHRGCGGSEAPAGPYSMKLLADDAVRLIDHLGWDRVHLVGVSMGGMMSQELALRYPDRLRSLTLIATHAGGGTARLPPLGVVLNVLLGLVGSDAERMRIMEQMLFPSEFLATCDRAWLNRVLTSDFGTPIPLKYRLSQLAAILRHDTGKRLHRLRGLPTLVVLPSQDRMVSPEACEQLSWRIPGARLSVYPEAGHGVIRQSHPKLNAELLEHFAAADAE